MASNGKTITDLADDVAGKTKRAAGAAKSKASEVIVEVKDEAAVIFEKTGAGAKSAASSGKDMAADAVAGLADAGGADHRCAFPGYSRRGLPACVSLSGVRALLSVL